MDMPSISNAILLFVLLLNMHVLGTSRLGTCIKMVALQGALLSLLPVLMNGFSTHALILTIGAFLLKGLLIPWLLFRAIRQVKIRREIEPRIGYIATLILGALATTGAFLFSNLLPLLPEHQDSLIIPAAIATLSTGSLLLITRSKAISQVLGYLMFENGIFIFGMLLVEAMPLMIETGVLLDMLVAIFVMGIVVNQINREFSSINTEHLALLRE